MKHSPFLTGCEFSFLKQIASLVSCILAFPFGIKLLNKPYIQFKGIIFSHVILQIFQIIAYLWFFHPFIKESHSVWHLSMCNQALVVSPQWIKPYITSVNCVAMGIISFTFVCTGWWGDHPVKGCTNDKSVNRALL